MSDYVPKIPKLRLIVPSGDTHIHKGSAVVSVFPGEPNNSAKICYYEGSKHIATWQEKLSIAAGRCSEKAPTSALTGLGDEDAIVGTVIWSEYAYGWIIDEITDQNLLNEWTGEQIKAGPSKELLDRAAGIKYGKLNSVEIIKMNMLLSQGRDVHEAILGPTPRKYS